MARPEPRILTSTLLGATWQEVTIAQAEGYYAVLFEGEPFSLITEQIDAVREITKKYPKTVFPHRGHAVNLARKLNHYFKSTDFEVVELISGERAWAQDQ